MALTPRFKFNYFGGSTPGTISQDGQKFTGLDRLTLDRLLAQVEAHDHKYHPPIEALTEPATGELLLEGGSLQGGYTYYYRYAVVDAQGNESIASVEASVATPALLAIPGMLNASAGVTSGSLTPGLYYYAVTALRGAEETPLGPAVLLALQPGETTARLALPPFGDADTLRVWRLGSTESGYTRIGTASVGTTEFIDDGSVPADPCACDPGNLPPSANTGASAYAVRITLPAEAIAMLPTARGWRLYRTVYPGIYPTASLVHEVVERESEWDPTSPLLAVWIDTGNPAGVGQPMDTDQNMRFQALTFDGATTLPDTAGYPEHYPLVVGGRLYVNIAGVWTTVGAGEASGTAAANVVMTSPNGTRYVLSVDDTGALVTTETPFPGPPSAPPIASLL